MALLNAANIVACAAIAGVIAVTVPAVESFALVEAARLTAVSMMLYVFAPLLFAASIASLCGIVTGVIAVIFTASLRPLPDAAVILAAVSVML